jgi:hypothetical protein
MLGDHCTYMSIPHFQQPKEIINTHPNKKKDPCKKVYCEIPQLEKG